ncbi:MULTISPECIES: patatin-like phospholipase family protein [unclassified Leucobacter]|uniref:patatin-like phospholipase family protein n=1 Tax=unclassified Leucobacter TaxID=2621730 RepID=UPI00165EB979|nr:MULTISPECIES: patatin-like phospholipase family protein [unclassified Leucobacter]MBC9926322.1 patatin-like phospholipase family protein [Leucobacter sp. cx-169]
MNHSTQKNVTHPTRTALVLGGGGSTGNAWLIGVVAGLYEAGLDVTDADVTVGTSAGSTAAAQLVEANPAELLASIRAAGQGQSQDRARARTGGDAARPVEDHLERSRRLIASSADAADMRRRFGAAAIDLASAHDPTERWRGLVATRFSARTWPERRVLITAVNAGTGEAVVFDRDSGADLVDAVAASCSSGSAYRIGDAQYIDGGYRMNAENADLAAGYERVLALSPFGGRTLTPASWGLDLATQVRELRAGGSEVETVVPNENAEHLFGANAMDLSKRLPAAEAGREQGVALAGRIAELWR